jgi:hypothetical protein
MHELCELVLGRGSRRSRRSWTAQVQVEPLEDRVVLSAALDAVNFAASMLNKLTVGGGGGDPTIGPYPEEGLRTGGRDQLEAYVRELIGAFGHTADVYVPKLNEFAPQFYFNDIAPNRARDSWVRDFDRLKVRAGATSSAAAADAPFESGNAEMSGCGDALALSAGGKKEPEVTCSPRLGGCGNEGRSALYAAGDPNGTPPDSPDHRIDPNTAASPFAGVGSIQLVRGKNLAGLGGSAVAIGPRHVLTAAHVVDINRNGHRDGADWDSIEFWLNLDTDSPVDRPDVIIPAAAWYIHPDSFHPGNHFNFFHDDIAVIELSTPLPEGVPIYQLYTGDLTGQTLHMVGYGRSGDGINGLTVPGSFTVKRVGQNVADHVEGQDDRDRPEAIELWQSDFDHPTDASLNFFGGPSLGNDQETTAGPGDSGGPAFIQIGNNPDMASSYQIGGVITHAIEGLSTFGLFGSGFGGTVVSAYVDWIQGILRGTPPDVGALERNTASIQGISASPPSADFACWPFMQSGSPLFRYDQPAIMPFRTADGSANADQDYIAKPGTLTFAPGETTKTITIEVNGDSEEEADETFYVDLFGNERVTDAPGGPAPRREAAGALSPTAWMS